MHRFLLFLIGMATLFEAASAQPQPPLEAYGTHAEIRHVALSDSGQKIAIITKPTEATVIDVDDLDLTDDERAALKKLPTVGSHMEVRQTNVLIYDFATGTYEIVPTNSGKVVHIDFAGENDLLIWSEFDRVIFIGDELQSRGVFHDVSVLSTEDMSIRRVIVKGKREPMRLIDFGPVLTRPNTKNEILMQGWWMPGMLSRRPAKLHLLKLNLDTAELRIESHGLKNTTDWIVSQSGSFRVREDYNNAGNSYKLVDVHNGKKRERFKLKNVERPPFTLVGLHPETDALVVLASYDHDVVAELTSEGHILPPFLARNATDIDYVFRDKDQVIEGVKYSGILPRYEFLDPELDADIQDLIAQTPGTSVTILDRSSDWQKILLRLEGNYTSGMYLIFDRVTKQSELIEEIRPDIVREAIGDALSFKYEARDGLQIEAIATLPPGTDISNASNLKTIVMPHGGPETYDAIGFDWMAQYFANRGYLVFQPNFRGSAGYGTAFVLAGNGEWGGKMQDDITDGLKALVNEGLADPDNVCIVGASYGGYAALAGGAFTPDLYRCVVAIAPVTDLHRMLKDEKRDYGRNHWVVDYWQERMADGEARKIKLRSVSPSEYADSFQSPVLLIHGDKDRIVPLKQSEIMHQALLDAGKLVTFITLERGDHALSTNEARLTTLQAASDFVEQHIGSAHSSLSTTPQTFAPSATDGP